MLDRNIQPKTFPISEFKPVKPVFHTLKNSMPFTGLHDKNMTLLRLDIRLKAGSYFQQKQAVSQATIKLLPEGTLSLSGDKIAEMLDYAGAYYEISPERDFVSFSVYFPKSATQTVLPIIGTLFTEATFPKDKIEILKNNLKRNLAVNLEKTSYLAYAKFAACAFGENHPYGVSLQMEDIDRLERDDIVDFYQNYFHAGNIRLFAAGNIDDELLKILENTFGNIPHKEPAVQKNIPIESTEKKVIVQKDNTVQSSICIGKRLFSYTHPDWAAMSVLTTILGGYFGSRLMTNIREDKGLTYGIYSYMSSLQQDGLFLIRADVNKENVQEATDEIYKEIQKLSDSPIPQEELDLVKNYLFGSLLRNFDGIFMQIDRSILLSDYHLSLSYWEHYIEVVRNINVQELQELAKTYLKPKSMIEVVAGVISD